eukprot:1363594-Prymnesium_polylepis.1
MVEQRAERTVGGRVARDVHIRRRLARRLQPWRERAPCHRLVARRVEHWLVGREPRARHAQIEGGAIGVHKERWRKRPAPRRAHLLGEGEQEFCERRRCAVLPQLQHHLTVGRIPSCTDAHARDGDQEVPPTQLRRRLLVRCRRVRRALAGGSL